jgi:hypothetical protein
MAIFFHQTLLLKISPNDTWIGKLAKVQNIKGMVEYLMKKNKIFRIYLNLNKR